MHRSSNHKNNKEARALNATLDQTDFTNIFRAFHPKATEYTFFLRTHGTLSRIDHILGNNQVSTGTRRLGSFPVYF